MEELLVKSGGQGIRSHMVLPPRTELMEGELKQRIKEADYDAVLVIRPKAFRKETQEVGTKSVFMPPPFYQNLWPYWDMASKQFSAKGSYLKENTDRKSTRLNSSHGYISYAVFCLKKKTQ